MNENTINEDNSTKWYPGKYLGRKKDEENEILKEKEQENEKNEEESKKESMICLTVRNIRQKYLERQLIGRIYIYRLSGVISTALTSEITNDDITNYLLKKIELNGNNSILENDPLIQAELTGQYKRALSTVDTILNSLERRSLAYITAEFSHTTLLTRGTTIGISDPFFGLIGFSFTLELSATAHSLIASRRRYEIARDLALDMKKREEQDQLLLQQQLEQEKQLEEEELNRSSSISTSTSKFSFSSFFSRKSNEQQPPPPTTTTSTDENTKSESTIEFNADSVDVAQETTPLTTSTITTTTNKGTEEIIEEKS